MCTIAAKSWYSIALHINLAAFSLNSMTAFRNDHEMERSQSIEIYIAKRNDIMFSVVL